MKENERSGYVVREEREEKREFKVSITRLYAYILFTLKRALFLCLNPLC